MSNFHFKQSLNQCFSKDKRSCNENCRFYQTVVDNQECIQKLHLFLKVRPWA